MAFNGDDVQFKRLAEANLLRHMQERDKLLGMLADVDESIRRDIAAMNCTHEWEATVTGMQINIDTCAKCGFAYAY